MYTLRVFPPKLISTFHYKSPSCLIFLDTNETSLVNMTNMTHTLAGPQ